MHDIGLKLIYVYEMWLDKKWIFKSLKTKVTKAANKTSAVIFVFIVISSYLHCNRH